MYALSLLRRRTGRALLTILGVALAVGLTTTMLSISAGLDTTSRRVIADTGIELVVVQDGADVLRSPHPALPNGTRLAAEIGDLQEVRRAFPIFEHTVTLYPSNFSACRPGCPAVNVLANGENPALRGTLGGIDIVEGSYFLPPLGDPFNASDEYRNHTYPGGVESPLFTSKMVVNRAVATELKAGINDTVYLSVDRRFENSTPFKIVGIYEAPFETGQSREVRVHLSELQYLARQELDQVTLVAVDLVDPSQAAAAAAVIEGAHPGLKAATPQEILGELDHTTGAFKVFAGLIAIVSIGVAVLFAATIFFISVRERIAEIAALRAIGLSRGSIFRSLLLESGVVGALGLAVGLLIGVVGAWAVDFVLKTTTTRVPLGMDVTAVTPDVVVIVGITSVVIGILAGLAPAVWATRLPIAAAIRNL